MAWIVDLDLTTVASKRFSQTCIGPNEEPRPTAQFECRPIAIMPHKCSMEELTQRYAVFQ